MMKTMLSLDLNEINQPIANSPQKQHILHVHIEYGGRSISYVNLLTGCPKHWPVIGNSCYYMTGETSSTIDDAQNKCKKISAKLPIIKSESENTFILDLMSKPKTDWVWLGMKRKQGEMVWFDNTPAESSDGAPYEDCAYLNFDQRGWNDNKCDHSPNTGPYVLCQKERKKYASSKTEW